MSFFSRTQNMTGKLDDLAAWRWWQIWKKNPENNRSSISSTIQTSGHTLALSECLAEDHGATCTASHRALWTDFPLDGATVGGRWGTDRGKDGRSSPTCFLGGVKRIWGTRPYSWKRTVAIAWAQAGRLVLGVKNKRAWIMWIGRHSRTKRERDRAREQTWQESCFGGSAWLKGLFLGMMRSRSR